MTQKNTHGGYREGAGRKPTGIPPKRPKTFLLTERHHQLLAKIDNASALVRMLLDAYFAQVDPEEELALAPTDNVSSYGQRKLT